MAHHGTLAAQKEYADVHRKYYRAYNVVYRRAHREYFKGKRRSAAIDKRFILNGLKNRPCVDCDGRFNPWVMQFDHINPALKRFNLGRSESKSVADILAEAKKCEVVCANCHAERTQRRRPRRTGC